MDIDVHQVRREAVARLLARQRPPEWKTARQRDGGEIRMQTAGWPGDFLSPVSVAEWADDMIARRSPSTGRAGQVLFVIMLAAREGRAAAVAAVGEARPLGAWDQWKVFRDLAGFRQGCAYHDAEPLMTAVIREWQRLGLVTAVPDEPVPVVTVMAAGRAR